MAMTMFNKHTHKPQNPKNKQTTKTDTPAPFSKNNIFDLHATVGNAAVQRMLMGTPSPLRIQRMPTKGAIISTLGKPHKNVLFVKQSTKYKHALDVVGDLDTYLLDNKLGQTKNEVTNQLKEIMRLFNAVIAACAAYDGDDGDKAEYFNVLKIQAQNEKGQWLSRMMELSANPNRYGGNQPKLVNVSPVSNMPLHLDEDKYLREVGGGTNKLGVFSGGGDNEFYFKQNRVQIDNPDLTEKTREVSQMPEGPAKEEEKKKIEAINNDNYNAEMAGIDKMDARTASRDVASYRLDSLLSANIIARTQFALRKVNGQSQLGSLMVGAKGKTGGKMGKTNSWSTQGGQTDINDPVLQRSLSRLQLLDSLALQVDRNQGNYYVETDPQGNVIKVTGIDNDGSFGTSTRNDKSVAMFPGFSMLVDEELAVRILELDTDLLQLVMMDLLSPAEITALLTRLDKLQKLLAPLRQEGKLLSPQQWDQATAQKQINERNGSTSTKSYYGNLGREVTL